MRKYINMNYTREHIAETLRKAREQKGLSQRALSNRAGVPQSHISKIENNAVDLRLSSLTAIAHALDLELTLIPRKAVPAVKSVTKSVGMPPTVDPAVGKEFRKIENALNAFTAHSAKREGLDNLQRTFRELNQFQNLVKEADPLRDICKTLENIDALGWTDAITRAVKQMNAVRNSLAHAQKTGDQLRLPRPAYRLGEGDDD